MRLVWGFLAILIFLSLFLVGSSIFLKYDLTYSYMTLWRFSPLILLLIITICSLLFAKSAFIGVINTSHKITIYIISCIIIILWAWTHVYNITYWDTKTIQLHDAEISSNINGAIKPFDENWTFNWASTSSENKSVIIYRSNENLVKDSRILQGYLAKENPINTTDIGELYLWSSEVVLQYFNSQQFIEKNIFLQLLMMLFVALLFCSGLLWIGFSRYYFFQGAWTLTWYSLIILLIPLITIYWLFIILTLLLLTSILVTLQIIDNNAQISNISDINTQEYQEV